MYSNTVIQALKDFRADSPVLDYTNINNVVANLVFIHQVITASEGLLEAAVEASEGELQEYFISHLEEERGHEKWLAADLMTQGVDVKTVPLSRKAVEMAGSQYYLIKHVNPSCLLGYMAVLEGFPVEIQAVEILESLHGKDLFKTLRYHCEHDLEHRKELFAMIDKFPSDDILRNAVQTAIYMNEFLSEINQ